VRFMVPREDEPSGAVIFGPLTQLGAEVVLAGPPPFAVRTVVWPELKPATTLPTGGYIVAVLLVRHWIQPGDGRLPRDVYVWADGGRWLVQVTNGPEHVMVEYRTESEAMTQAGIVLAWKWPFRVRTHCTDPESLRAARRHVEDAHGWQRWRERPWEQIVSDHQDDHARRPGLVHDHLSLPDVSW